jgi:3',5'-cyclic-AMP phosphodiesterase
MTFRIAQVSDTHLSAAKPFFVENFRRVGEALKRGRPDLVVNTGDISLDGARGPDDLAEARRLHDALGLPVKCIPGNHDVGDNVELPSPHGVIDNARRTRYVEHFGADWWSMDVPGWRLLAVNAQLVGSGLDAAREQLQFVAKAAASAGEQRIALFVHKPLFDKRSDEAVVGGRFLNPLPRRELLGALGDARPALVACGHVHQFRETKADGACHIWGPSTGYFIPDTRQPRYGVKEVGYVLHELEEGGTHTSSFVQVEGTQNFSIADFPAAYGPMD